MTAPTILHADGPTQSRPLEGEEDWWRVRGLLVDAYALTPPDWNWDLRRWDGQRFHRENIAWDAGWSQRVRLWMTSDDTLVAAMHPEDNGTVWFQVHPDYRHLEPEMLGWAESELAVPIATTPERELRAFAYDYDSPRRRLFREKGYTATSEVGVVRRLRLGRKALPQPEISPGYVLRTTRAGDEADCQRMAALLNAAFGRTIHSTAEYLNFTRHSPSFRHELNWVAEAADGSLAAHVGVTYDQANGRGIVEPVCTHPDHRRRGLARTLLFAGLLRLKALGAVDVYVGTGDDEGANQFYEAAGFDEAYRGSVWRKVW